MRIGCSKLKSDLHHNLHVEPDSLCSCGHPREDARHFLLECPLHEVPRRELVFNLRTLGPLSAHKLLWGDHELPLRDNEHIATCLQNYVRQTKRFFP